MNNIFIISGLISITYLILKFIEMRVIEKENKPLKVIIKDTLIVYFSIIIGNFFIRQIGQLMSEGNNINKNTPVFTDNPGF
jgi:hypothetical protein